MTDKVPTIPDDLADNYRQLKAERGCTWAQLAAEAETGDPSIAAWFRAQNEDTKAPAKRSAPKKSTAAQG